MNGLSVPPATEREPARATVLIVDDQPENLALLARVLQPLYCVKAARSGEQALLAATADPRPDLILLDIMMPQMDGYTVLARLREDPAAREIPVIFVTALDSTENEERGLELGAVDYISKPIVPAIVLARVHTHLTLSAQTQELRELNASLDVKVREQTERLRQALASLEAAHEQLKKGFTASVRMFSNLLEMRGQNMAGHSRRVADDARKLALEMQLPESDVQDILLAGLVHDIGKIGLPDQLVDKPFAELSATERGEMIKHTERGAAVLMGMDQFKEAARLVRWHHERYDGEGFPDGLRGEEIPLGARILAVVNEFDALRSGALTGKQMGRSGAMSFLLENKGKRYDPKVVDAFFKLKTYAGVSRGEGQGSDRGLSPGHATRYSKSVALADLKPGMVLARPVILPDGLLLLAEGHILTRAVIDQLIHLAEDSGKAIRRVNIRPSPGPFHG